MTTFTYTIEASLPADADADALAHIHLATSLSAPSFKVTYGACSHEDLLTMWKNQTRESYNSSSGSSQKEPDPDDDDVSPQRRENHYLSLKVVDKIVTGEIAAYAVWTFLPGGYEYLEDSELFRSRKDDGSSSYPPGVNLRVLEEFSDKVVGLRRRWITGIKPLWRMYFYLFSYFLNSLLPYLGNFALHPSIHPSINASFMGMGTDL